MRDTMNQQAPPSKPPQTVLDTPQIKKIVTECLKDKLNDQAYDSQKAPDWLAKSVQSILQKLLEKDPKFKIVVHGIILQRVGAGLHTTSTCFGDPKDDTSVSVRWDNQSMHAIISVYCLKHT